MGKHEFLDTVIAGAGAMYGDMLKFFSEGATSASLEELVAQCSATVPEWNTVGEYEADVQTPLGPIPTKFSVLAWAGPEKPLLIFHHGSGDVPYYTRAKKVLGAGRSGLSAPFDAGINVIATNSPFNDSRKTYYGAIRDLERFGVLLAGSVALIEALIGALPDTAKSIVSGISLGGWIANLHHACFDTADEYRPIFAGAALDRLFIESAYRKLTGKGALEHPDVLRNALNFELAFARRSNANVYPLMARYDQYIVLEHQASIYNADQTTIIDRGHITGSTDNETIRAFLGSGLRLKKVAPVPAR